MEGKSSRDSASTIGAAHLRYAAKNGDVSSVTSLLNAGCNVNEPDKCGKTALMLAVEGLHEKTIAALLKFNANIHAKDKFDKSIFKKVFGLSLKHRVITQMFLNALKKECVGDSKKLAMKLLSVGCPLYWAVFLRDIEVTRILVENGLAIDAKDLHNPNTALHITLLKRDFANAKLLMECGADVNALNSFGRIPLACLTGFDDSDKELEIVKMSIDRNSKLDSIDSYGYIQTHEILLFGKSKVLHLVLKANIDWSLRDLYGSTPLHYLARNFILHEDPDIFDHIRKIKITVDDLNISASSLFTLAANVDSPKFVELLLDKGANPNIRTSDGNTPLLNVSTIADDENNADKIISLLLQYGADCQIPNNRGTTVLEIILDTTNVRAVKIFAGHLAFIALQGTQITKKIRSIINSVDDLRHEFEACKVQLKELQQITIGNAINLFRILKTSEKWIAVLARDQDFFNDMTSFKDSTLNPYYADIFQRKVEKTLQLIKFRKKYSDLICQIMGIRNDSYPEIINAIIDYIIA